VLSGIYEKTEKNLRRKNWHRGDLEFENVFEAANAKKE
jgi:hypothetical protein